MPSVELDIKELQERRLHIMCLLKPLSRKDSGPACDQQLIGNSRLMLGAHEGVTMRSRIREWRFATPQRDCWANYYELWELVDSKSQRYCLNRAYLTIYRRNHTRYPAEEEELLCLHCDPYEPDDGTNLSVVYKRSPHLHIEAADEPIPKAHFALAIGNLTEVLASTVNLTKSLAQCIEMIRHEVLDRMGTP